MAEKNDEPTQEQLDDHWRAVYDGEAETANGYYRELSGGEMYPLAQAVVDFSVYMQRDDIIGYVRRHRITCLADALSFWLSFGSATRFCPTYESYLQVVIHIIAVWNEEEGFVYNDLSESFSRAVPPGWSYDALRFVATEPVTIRIRGELPYGRKRIVLPTLVRSDSEVQIWTHPALSKDNFEHAHHRRMLGMKDSFVLDTATE